MSAIDQRQLTIDVVNILERMAFVLCEEAEEPRMALSDYVQHVQVDMVSEGVTSMVNLSGDKGFLLELASSMLGIMPEDVKTENEGSLALLELGNVVSGEVVREFGGEHIEFDLGLPRSVAEADMASFESKQGDPTTLTCLESDDGYLRIAVFHAANV